MRGEGRNGPAQIKGGGPGKSGSYCTRPYRFGDGPARSRTAGGQRQTGAQLPCAAEVWSFAQTPLCPGLCNAHPFSFAARGTPTANKRKAQAAPGSPHSCPGAKREQENVDPVNTFPPAEWKQQAGGFLGLTRPRSLRHLAGAASRCPPGTARRFMLLAPGPLAC